jgi:beta-lactamase class A
MKIILGLFVIGCIGLAGWAVATGNVPLKEKAEKTVTQTAAKVVKKEKPLDETALNARMDQIITDSNFDTSIALVDLQTNKTYTYGDTAPYTAASINKLVTVLAYLHKVEQGDATLSQYVGSDTAQNQIQKALVNSDNAAWESFYISKQVSCSAHNAYAASIRLASYECVQNVISAPDAATMLTKLYQGKLLNKAHTDLVLGYMKQANYRQYIVSAVPDNLTVYHKVGYLTDRVHDGAIITNGKKSYVLVVFTKVTGAYDEQSGIKLFQSVTKATNKLFLNQN